MGLEGIKIGHATDLKARTGCTVVLCETGAIAAVDVRGGGPATRETDLLRPENTVDAVNAIVLSGGSAFGLDAAGGVMRWLEEHGCGFDAGVCKVPIVCGASLFDLAVGRADVRPDAAMGYAACEAAVSVDEAEAGAVGAGAGATVGKLAGFERAMDSGLGISILGGAGGLAIAAIAAVNAVGTVVDADGTPLAGVRTADGAGVLSPEEALDELASLVVEGASAEASNPMANTTISCIVTNARLTKAQATKVASMAHDGYARAINPVHTTMDGDTVFVLATGEVEAGVDQVGIAAADAIASAIRRSVQ